MNSEYSSCSWTGIQWCSRETSTETKGKPCNCLHLPQMCKSETTDSSNNIICTHSPETQPGTFCPEIRL